MIHIPFKLRDEEIRNMSDRDLLILQHERSSAMKEDLLTVLDKVLNVCEKQNELEKKVVEIDSRCTSHHDIPTQLRELNNTSIKMSNDISNIQGSLVILTANQNETNKRIVPLEDKVRIVGFGWNTISNSNTIKTMLLILSCIGVFWGRVGQYGWHIVGGFLFVVLIVLIVTWMMRRENRNNVMRLLHV